MAVTFDDVLAKAAELQAVVPGAVLVEGSAAALHAHHPESADNDHVVADLAERFDTILENLEALGEWSAASVKPGKIILGDLGGIETGVRQLLRSRPLETVTVEAAGRPLVVPTLAETLRIKAWLLLSRNRTRDYVDVAALACTLGMTDAATVLLDIDTYYADLNRRADPVATQLLRQLSDPQPSDPRVTEELDRYKAVQEPWQDWSTVTSTLAQVAAEMLA